ncbi:MAG: hypothetical protein D6769_03270 [Methanobacteriota archaeon]|nr:MAG: hypothetical protein D6769_03270 [Euryarchaeota archaeon]
MYQQRLISVRATQIARIGNTAMHQVLIVLQKRADVLAVATVRNGRNAAQHPTSVLPNLDLARATQIVNLGRNVILLQINVLLRKASAKMIVIAPPKRLVIKILMYANSRKAYAGQTLIALLLGKCALARGANQ